MARPNHTNRGARMFGPATAAPHANPAALAGGLC